MLRTILNASLIAILFLSNVGYAAPSDIPKTVVSCTMSSCPAIPSILNPNEEFKNQAIIYQTSNQPEFMSRRSDNFSNTSQADWQKIIIDETKLSDTHPIIGFGGAFTDSASLLYQHMTPALQSAFINTYFSSAGIEFSLGRVPMGSTDFSCRTIENQSEPTPSLSACSNIFSLYSYADKAANTIDHFALQAEDLQFKIPLIKAAIRATQKNRGDLKLFASPWSAPAWMKTTGNMVNGSLNPEHQQLWADYFIKFFKAYQAKQITFWGLTVQNEPVEGNGQTWQSMFLTLEQEAEFIKKYLGPALTKFEETYGSKINIIMHDDLIVSITNRVSMLNDPDVAKYVAGAGLHWYMNIDQFFGNLDKAYQTLNATFPQQERFILSTEACEGYLPTRKGPSLGNWARGEAYAHDIMLDLNHHVSGWNDWNLVLDMSGGPTWAKNYVDAAILVDLKAQTFYRQPMYYYLGHFSKFLRPGARLLLSESKGPAPLERVTFKVPAYNGLPETIVVVVLNRDWTGRNYYISDLSRPEETRYLNLHIPGHAIQTIIYKANA